MNVETAKLLFGMISVDDTLPTRNKRTNRNNNNTLNNDTMIDDAATNTDDIIMEEGNQPEAAVVLATDLNPAKNKVTVSSQTYQNYKSALKWWHEFESPDMEKIGKPWPREVDVALKKAIATYKRDVGDKKRRGVMKQKEGKSPFSLNGYIVLCKHFMAMKPQRNATTWNEGLFASLFTKLSVNTISRSDNIDDLLLEHISWENDALTLLFSTTKADQTGATTSEMKRLYANPFTPSVCVVLDLAVYTWCKHKGNKGEAVHLFNGDDQNKRYYNILVDAVRKIPEHIDLGCDRNDIGTHSNRKFAESTSVSKIDGPSRTQVCLRAGQGVGRTQDCYMFSEQDGDSLVGRTVAQLKLNADEFDILCPHFGTNTLNELHDIGWNNILRGYEYYPTSFQRVVPYLLANLVYHWFKGNLQQLYDVCHPLFAQALFTEPTLINSLRDKVIIVHAYCDDTRMNAEGIPGIIMISREIRNFRTRYDTTCDLYDQRINELKGQINSVHQELPQTIVDLLLQRFQINGAIPISITEIRSLINEMLSSQYQTITHSLATITAQQSSMIQRIENGGLNNNQSVNPSNGDSQARMTAGNLFRWIGIDELFHRVPHGFKFPSYTCYTMWNLWFFGNANENICAYKAISREHDLETKACKTNQTRAKTVINKLVSIAINNNKITRASAITTINSVEIFNFSYPILLGQLYPKSPKRPEDININTLANRMYLNKE